MENWGVETTTNSHILGIPLDGHLSWGGNSITFAFHLRLAALSTGNQAALALAAYHCSRECSIVLLIEQVPSVDNGGVREKTVRGTGARQGGWWWRWRWRSEVWRSRWLVARGLGVGRGSGWGWAKADAGPSCFRGTEGG